MWTQLTTTEAAKKNKYKYIFVLISHSRVLFEVAFEQ
jgi:hypothetical protein